MFFISCPWCGPRDETEFSHGGEAHIVRPAEPDRLSDAEWADYVFLRSNPKGVHRERWFHVHGCRRWFNSARDTVTQEFLAIYKIGERPSVPGEVTPESASKPKPPSRAKKKAPARRKAPKS